MYFYYIASYFIHNYLTDLNKNTNILLLLFVFLSFNLLSQNLNDIDSLKNKFENAKSDKEKVVLLNKISRKFYGINPDSTENFARIALKKSEEINFSLGKAKSYRMIGLSFLARSEYDKALKYLFLSADELKKNNNIIELATVYTSIGIVYRQKSDYNTALKYYLKTLEIVKSKNDSSRMSPAYNNIGVVYKNMKDYDKALLYYKKSLKIKENINDRKNLPYTLGNIGVIYLKNKQYDDAISTFQKILNMFTEQGNKNETANTFMQLAKTYMFIKNYDLAKENINKSINLYNEVGDKFGLSDAYIVKGNIYFLNSDYTISEKFFKKSLKVSQEIKANEQIMNNYLYLSKLDSTIGNYKSSLNYFHNYIQLKDKIFSQKKQNAITLIQAQYDFSEKERENIILRKNQEINDIEMHKQKNLTNFIWAFSALLVIIVFIVIFSWLKLQKSNKLLNQKNEEILAQNISLEEHKEKIISQFKELETYKTHLEKLVKERTSDLNVALEDAQKSDRLKTEFLLNLSHEVRTPINAISGFSDVILNKKGDFKIEHLTSVQKSMDALLNTINRLVTFSNYKIGTYKIVLTKINLTDFFIQFNETTLKRQKFLGKENLNISFNTNSLKGKDNFVIDVSILKNIMTELVDNAFKFTSEGTIAIKAKIIENNCLYISVKDSGVGIKDDIVNYVFDYSRKFDTKTKLYRGMGVGLAIVKKAVELLSGKIIINPTSNKGAEFIITIPPKN